ncbi:YgdI/YgdR family lipoprotein [Pectobacterium cacticida]|uniref:YgdI/YgdR family lipoprotein n=1 Tax=Pectobacterium cacticida TaxID=69221 RepID=UPI0039877EA2
MKIGIKAAITSTLLFTLAGCSSHYVIATKTGEIFLTQGKPVLDQDTGLLRYTDEQGNQKQINGDQISQIARR